MRVRASDLLHQRATGITSVEGSRACACGRVWAPRTSSTSNRVRWHNPKPFITISSASRSVWRQANPSVPVSQRVREALSNCGPRESAIAAGKDWPMAAHLCRFIERRWEACPRSGPIASLLLLDCLLVLCDRGGREHFLHTTYSIHMHNHFFVFAQAISRAC